MIVAAIIKKPILVRKMRIAGTRNTHTKCVSGFRKHLQKYYINYLNILIDIIIRKIL